MNSQNKTASQDESGISVKLGNEPLASLQENSRLGNRGRSVEGPQSNRFWETPFQTPKGSRLAVYSVAHVGIINHRVSGLTLEGPGRQNS